MQYSVDEKKILILEALAQTMIELRGEKSQFLLGTENDISTSIISEAERAKKDPQLTTIFKLAEAYGVTPMEFIKLIHEKLPNNFSLIEN